MSFEIRGTVHKIYDETVYSETFKKREFILSVQDGEYTQYLKFQTINTKTQLLNGIAEGDPVTVTFTPVGREYVKSGEKQYFTNLDAWKIEFNQT